MEARDLKPLPTVEELRTAVHPFVFEIASAVRDAGGQTLLVGGFVRDWLLGIRSKDLDVEVRALELDDFERILQEFGDVKSVGRSFGVLRISGLDVDFGLPRRDSKVGPGHKGIRAEVDPHLDFIEAARRRDLTVNAMAIDPLTAEFLDPFDGRIDLGLGILSAADANHFGEDPLRAMRVIQFAARFDMQSDEQLLAICAQQDLSELSGERVFDEFRKLLLRAAKPSVGLQLLEQAGLLRYFPELEAMVGVPQDPKWHPEGDVWVHTCMVVDEAAALRLGDHNDAENVERDVVDHDLALMFAALCHDLGKPETTFEEGGRIKSPAHDSIGANLSREFLSALQTPKALTNRITALVRDHLAPSTFYEQGSSEKAYRRLSRRLGKADVSMSLLELVARADHFGRTTEEALARVFPGGEHFLERVKELEIADGVPADVVTGAFLLERGYEAGPAMGKLLEKCRAVQDETGWVDAERILGVALGG